MNRILAYIESRNADNYHKTGQELLTPFSWAFGHSFRVVHNRIFNNNEVEKLNENNTIRKIILLCVAVLIFPVTLIAGAIGCICLLMSNSHKQQYFLIQERFRELAPPLVRATDSVESYNFEVLKKISDRLITSPYYRELIPPPIYQIKTEFGVDTVAHTCYPQLENEIALYQNKVPSIVNAVRLALEDTLNRAVKISEILKVLDENHQKLFPFIF